MRRHLIAEVDRDADGKVSYDEFLDLWLKQNPGGAVDVGEVGELSEGDSDGEAEK